jgi:carbon monoxide dehydrogenase subunit G
VWVALRDPDVLLRTLPGCRWLERTAPDTYALAIEANLASIRGLCNGTVSLRDLDPPLAYTVHASGQGAPGTLEATARVRLADLDDRGTRVTYDADGLVGGEIAGVGGRVLAAAVQRNAERFLAAVEAALLSARAEAAESRIVLVPRRRGPSSRGWIVVGAVLASAGLVAGVLVGRWIRR